MENQILDGQWLDDEMIDIDEMIKEDVGEIAELTDKLIAIWKSSLDESKI